MLLKELLLPSFCSNNKGDHNYSCGFKLIFLKVSPLQFLIFPVSHYLLSVCLLAQHLHFHLHHTSYS